MTTFEFNSNLSIAQLSVALLHACPSSLCSTGGIRPLCTAHSCSACFINIIIITRHQFKAAKLCSRLSICCLAEGSMRDTTYRQPLMTSQPLPPRIRPRDIAMPAQFDLTSVEQKGTAVRRVAGSRERDIRCMSAITTITDGICGWESR